MRRVPLLTLIALAQFSLSAAAQVLAPQYPGGFKPQFDEDKPFEEQQASLPAYPVAESLIRIDVGPATAFEFFVDPASVSVGKDGVIRYTLVARSSSGAMNVSYEGIRCASGERKLYAFGRADKTWAPARRSDWARISSAQVNRQHATLADEFFCPVRGAVRSDEEAVAALKRGGHPRARSLPDQPR
jgi:hypothetical protein